MLLYPAALQRSKKPLCDRLFVLQGRALGEQVHRRRQSKTSYCRARGRDALAELVSVIAGLASQPPVTCVRRLPHPPADRVGLIEGGVQPRVAVSAAAGAHGQDGCKVGGRRQRRRSGSRRRCGRRHSSVIGRGRAAAVGLCPRPARVGGAAHKRVQVAAVRLARAHRRDLPVADLEPGAKGLVAGEVKDSAVAAVADAVPIGQVIACLCPARARCKSLYQSCESHVLMAATSSDTHVQAAHLHWLFSTMTLRPLTSRVRCHLGMLSVGVKSFQLQPM